MTARDVKAGWGRSRNTTNLYYITVYTKDNQNNDPTQAEKNVVQHYFYYNMYFKRQENENIE